MCEAAGLVPARTSEHTLLDGTLEDATDDALAGQQLHGMRLSTHIVGTHLSKSRQSCTNCSPLRAPQLEGLISRVHHAPVNRHILNVHVMVLSGQVGALQVSVLGWCGAEVEGVTRPVKTSTAKVTAG